MGKLKLLKHLAVVPIGPYSHSHGCGSRRAAMRAIPALHQQGAEQSFGSASGAFGCSVANGRCARFKSEAEASAGRREKREKRGRGKRKEERGNQATRHTDGTARRNDGAAGTCPGTNTPSLGCHGRENERSRSPGNLLGPGLSGCSSPRREPGPGLVLVRPQAWSWSDPVPGHRPPATGLVPVPGPRSPATGLVRPPVPGPVVTHT